MQEIIGNHSLKNIRELRKLTQEEAASKIGISKDTLSNYERGKSYPDIPILRRIEKTYGVKYNQIIFLPLDYDKVVNVQWNEMIRDGKRIWIYSHWFEK